MKSPAWRIMLRRSGRKAHHYAQTQRPGRIPQRGQIIEVRDVDGALVKARITLVRHGKPTKTALGIYIVEMEETEAGTTL